jgi:transposase
MEPPRTARELEYVRHLAVSWVEEGELPGEVAEQLGVSERSVWRWLASWRRDGPAGLAARPGRGRPAKLTPTQAVRVLGWLDRSPCAFGFATERWTAPRVAALIERDMGVSMNPRYLNDWLARRGITPQVPETVARERDQALIDAWVRYAWPRVKKRRAS